MDIAHHRKQNKTNEKLSKFFAPYRFQVSFDRIRRKPAHILSLSLSIFLSMSNSK